MERSLSVFLPIHNGQSQLESAVTRMLEVLPELTRRFEVLIIDDGSSDATVEVAHDLAMRYPQVNFVRHNARLGLAEAIQTGLDASGGEVIFVHDGQSKIDPLELPRLWHRRIDQGPIGLPQSPSASTSWIGNLLGWIGRSKAPVTQVPAPSSFYMLRRRAVEQSRRASDIARPPKRRQILQVCDESSHLPAADLTTEINWAAPTSANGLRRPTHRGQQLGIHSISRQGRLD